MSIQSVQNYNAAFAANAYQANRKDDVAANGDGFAALLTQPQAAVSSGDSVALSPAAEKALEAPKKALTSYDSLEDWKKDREGYFLKYQDAGERVGTFVEVAFVTGQDVLKAGGEVSQSFMNPNNNVLLDKMRGEFAAKTQESAEIPEVTTGRVLSDQEVRGRYGNYFVYQMEKRIGDIYHGLDAIKGHEDVVSSLLVGGDVHEESVVSAQEDLEYHAASLQSSLHELNVWAKTNNIQTDVKSFFNEFTRDFCERPLDFDAVMNAFGSIVAQST